LDTIVIDPSSESESTLEFELLFDRVLTLVCLVLRMGSILFRLVLLAMIRITRPRYSMPAHDDDDGTAIDKDPHPSDPEDEVVTVFGKGSVNMNAYPLRDLNVHVVRTRLRPTG
jgi:hypothetical protein